MASSDKPSRPACPRARVRQSLGPFKHLGSLPHNLQPNELVSRELMRAFRQSSLAFPPLEKGVEGGETRRRRFCTI